MDEESQRRLGANEAALREVNEAIERGQWPGEEQARVGFRCECAQLGCNRLIEISIREYERVRRHPRRFVVASGHELPAEQTIIEPGDGWVVVEKRDQAGAVAEASDPRG